MRFATLTAVLMVASLASQVSATVVGGGGGGGSPKYTSLKVINKCDGAVTVSVNGAILAALEPGESTSISLSIPKGGQDSVLVSATLVGTPISTSQSATLLGEKKATATITSPTVDSLAINFSGPGLVAANTHREATIVLASTGGLLPALAIAMLLGRPWRKRNLVAFSAFPADRKVRGEFFGRPAMNTPTLSRLQFPLMLLTEIVCGCMIALPWLDERTWPCAWLGLSVWMSCLARHLPHVAFRMSLLVGIASAALAYHWLPVVVRGHLDVTQATSCFVALLVIVWDALRFGVFGYLVARCPSRHSLMPPLVWVGLEWVWPHVVPWRLGQTQLGWPAFCQIAEVTGVYGVSFLVVWCAAVIASLPEWFRDNSEGLTKRHPRYLQAIACALVLISNSAWGAWRMQQIDREAVHRPQLRVALIQSGIGDDPALSRLKIASLTLKDKPDLVIWGEGSVHEFYSQDLQAFHVAEEVKAMTRDDSSRVAPTSGLTLPLLFGACSYEEHRKDDGPFHNTAFLVDHHQEIIGRYHKRVLMPWGEYAVGQQWIPGVRSLMSDVESFVPGDSSAPLELPLGARLGVLICYEDVLANPARQTVLEGADVLINLNNLRIFGDSAAIYEHQQLARFRAIENRRSLVRCGTTGSTAIISATGEVTHQSPYCVPATLIASVPRIDQLTLYTRYGDLLAICCTIAGLMHMSSIGRQRFVLSSRSYVFGFSDRRSRLV
jgi:apolipoprotein N-acyltransferase